MDAGPVVPHAVRLSLRTRVLAPIRGSLSVMGIAAAVLYGARPESALLAWTFGAVLVSIVLAGDPRGRRTAPPEPLPGDAVLESWPQIVRTDVYPSMVGVAVLTFVALVFDPIVSAVLAGILGGMALMTMLSALRIAATERRLGGVLFVQRGSQQLYLLERMPTRPIR